MRWLRRHGPREGNGVRAPVTASHYHGEHTVNAGLGIDPLSWTVGGLGGYAAIRAGFSSVS